MKFRSNSLFFGLLVLFAFQNCSKNLKDAEDPNNQSQVDPNLDPAFASLPTPAPYNFRSGERFSAAALGGALSTPLHSLLSSSNYLSSSSMKAIAVSNNGLGAVRVLNGGTQADADRMAVESCNAISGASCALAVSGDYFAVDSSQLRSAATMRLIGGSSALSPADVPFILDSERSTITSFLSTSSSHLPFKTLALAVSGEIRFGFGQSQNEADRRALQVCELEAELPPCLVFAQGNQRVFELNRWERISKLRLSPAFVKQNELPFILESDLPNLDAFFRRIQQGFVGALAIGRTGSRATYEAALPETAAPEALNRCKTYDTSCVLYSLNQKVALSWDQLASSRISREATCAIPRASCSAHTERGCAPGDRWLSVNGRLTYRTCL